MQEGIIALMQMAKTSCAVDIVNEAGDAISRNHSLSACRPHGRAERGVWGEALESRRERLGVTNGAQDAVNAVGNHVLNATDSRGDNRPFGGERFNRHHRGAFVA